MKRLAALVIGATLTAASGCAPDPPQASVGITVDSCDPGLESGSGALLESDLVLTAAHVVAGASTIRIFRDGWESEGRIVAFDPDMDLALLAVDAPLGTGFELSLIKAQAGDRGTAYVMRDGTIVQLPVTIERPVNIRTEDIYLDGATVRPGYEVTAAIQPGDSGGAVLIDGAVVGVVWARSNRVDQRAYLIDPRRAGERIEQQLSSGQLGDVDINRCH